MTTLTIFTAPKPFVDPHISMIQRNAIRSWQALGDDVEIFLIGDEEGIGSAASDLGVRHIPDVECSASGVPLISSIFSSAREQSSGDLLAYVNADIIVLRDFLDTAERVAGQCERFLLVGRRWDLDIRNDLNFSTDWQDSIRQKIEQEGHLHLPSGSDYFIFPSECFQDVPDFVVGRAGWDNWMLFNTRWMGWPLINATGEINIVHQRHDYSHLPGGRPHYRHPDSYENIRKAGGQWAIFTLADTNYHIKDGKVVKGPLNIRKFFREIEILPVRLRSRWLGKTFYSLFHPLKTYRDARRWLHDRLKSRQTKG
jgi:hypothetical protein